MKSKIIYLALALFMTTLMYGQIETHVYTAFAVGTKENVLDQPLEKTYSLSVLDWDNSVFMLEGEYMNIGRHIFIKSADTVEFTAESNGYELMILLGRNYLLVRNNDGDAIVYLKHEEINKDK